MTLGHLQTCATHLLGLPCQYSDILLKGCKVAASPSEYFCLGLRESIEARKKRGFILNVWFL